jgi:cytochrome bd-type quinol oxidase subunit 2
MIQRPQTVFLLLGALALGAMGLFDVPWHGAASRQSAWFVPSLLGLGVVTAVLAIGAIFLYTDQARRKTQRTVVVGVQILTVLLAGVLYVGFYRAGTLAFTDSTGILWGRTIVLLLPIVAYVLFRLARNRIETDIERVEEMNQGRIR